jgi:hypothetical protein
MWLGEIASEIFKIVLIYLIGYSIGRWHERAQRE